MPSTSQKHRDFVAEPMGEKDVNALAGIGPILGGRLKENGFDKAYVVLGQFLLLKKDETRFCRWLKDTCGAKGKQQRDCFECLRDWCDAFMDQLLELRITAVLPHERPDVPVVPSIIMGNVRFLRNKMDELKMRTQTRKEYHACSLFLLTETWLSAWYLDTAVALDGFKLLRADRTEDSSMRTGGGLAVFVNNSWCNPEHITIKEQRCSRDIELLAVSMRPYYLPREFSHVIAMTVYIPLSANAATACDDIQSVADSLQREHPQALLLISGHFDHVSLSSTLHTFTQYVTCCTRDNETLDLCYANTKEAYTSSPLPPLGRSDHNLVHLLPLVHMQCRKLTIYYR